MLKRMALGLSAALILSGCSTPAQQQRVNAQYSLPLVSQHATVASRSTQHSRVGTHPVVHDFKPLRVSPSVIREALLDEHQRWIGTPYTLGGTSFRGVDCSSLMQHVFTEAFSLDLPRTTEEQVLEGDWVSKGDLKAGDLVFFKPPGAYNHVGVFVGDGYFLHASTSKGVKLSRLDNVYWGRYYWQARRPMERTQLAQRVALVHEG